MGLARTLLRPVKRGIKRTFNRIRYHGRLRQPVHWLSLGENCLPDDILRRYERKTYSSPFSSGRSNIDYVLQLERDGYRYLLLPEHLTHHQLPGELAVRSTYYRSCEGIFDPSCSQGFEFTHHDPLGRIEDRRGLQRKISRLQVLKGRKHFVFLYHHRRNSNSDLPRLREKLQEFRKFYTAGRTRCAVILFYQTLVDRTAARRVECRQQHEDFIEFEFHTHDIWAGENQDLFWARVDEDLIREMLAISVRQLPLAAL
jgi:hypothetical protein